MQQLSPQDLASWVADASRPAPLLLDVREPWELEICRIAGSRALPMQQVPEQLQSLDEDAEIVVICHHGMRSLQVAAFLERNGFTCVFNLQGGIEAWASLVDPAMAHY